MMSKYKRHWLIQQSQDAKVAASMIDAAEREFAGLPTRTSNAFIMAGILTRAAVEAKYKDHSLHWANAGIRNYGKRGYLDTCSWLGAEPIMSSLPWACPNCGQRFNG